MMTMELESWLKQATRHLSAESAVRVRSEISEHYESARETALSLGSTPEAASRIALEGLGDAKVTNRQYRKVLLTSAEAKRLREAQWEAKVLCARPWLRKLLWAVPVLAFAAAGGCWLAGSMNAARLLFLVGAGLTFLFATPFLPVYTPMRARVYRGVKWVALLVVFGMAFGPGAMKMSWLMISCLWPVVWIEWTRYSIRRKLPVAEWPKALYL